MRRTLWALFAVGYAVHSFAYKAAFVEHPFRSPCGQGNCGQETKAASVRSYAQYAAQAAREGAQIIVFPEYGITGESSYPKSAWLQGGYTEVVPEPSGEVPCDSATDYGRAPSIVSISCIAQEHKIAIVVNLIDYQSGRLYNTDVAFDTNGKLLAKYHKQNLWGEFNVDVPAKCAEVTYTTSFGVTFGMFTCADIIFENPAVTLAKRGIRDFAVPVAWSSEEASLQIMPYAQSWSAAYGTNLIISNLRKSTESGSGVWASGRTLASQYSPGGRTAGVVVVDVPEVQHIGIPFSNHAADAVQIRFDLARITYPATTQWQFVELSRGRVCSGSVCCTAEVRIGGASDYVLAALDGFDGEEGVTPFPAQVCAVLPCNHAGSSCLTHRASQGNLQSVQIHMTGVSSGSLIPEVFANDEALLTSGSLTDGFTFSRKGQTASLVVSTSKKIDSALLYGRMFSMDNLPYQCGPSDKNLLIIS